VPEVGGTSGRDGLADCRCAFDGCPITLLKRTFRCGVQLDIILVSAVSSPNR